MAETDAAASAGAAPAGDWAIYRRVLGYVADQKRWFALAIAGALLTAGGEAGFAHVFGRVVDALAAPEPGDVWLLPAAMIVIALARALGMVAGEYSLSRISLRAVHRIRSDIFDALLVLPKTFFDGNPAGPLISRMTYTAGEMRDTGTDALKAIVVDGLKVLVYLGAMLYINALLTLSFLLIAPVVGFLVRYASKRFRTLSERIQMSMGDVTQITSEAVIGHREVRIFGGQRYERGRFRAMSDANRRQNLKMATTKVASAQVIQCLAAASLALLVGLIFAPGIGGGMTPGEFATFLGLAGAMANPLKKLSDVNARLQRGLAAAADIFALLDEAPERDAGSVEVDRVAGAIRFENVSFAYRARREDGGGAAAPSGKPGLHRVDLRIEPGQTVALVGRSGAGKSTLASLIARFHDPTAGRILLDGVPLDGYRLSCLRRQIALVTQNVTLFNDTLANNIAYGAMADAPREAIAEAARRAHADVFAARLPNGLDTLLGENGVGLSGGEEQRVAIARALLKDAPVLILDEATSALDAHSERHVQAALEEVMRDRTTIVIAHRLSTVENADRIVVLEGGAIIETGAHAQLIEADGAYAALYRSQLKGDGDSAARGVPSPPARPAPLPATVPAASAFAPLVGAWHRDARWLRLLAPLAALFSWLARRRRQRYLSGRSPAWRAPVPVIVVGNISAGGTGKTPLVVYLARWLQARGVRVGVVARGYGGRARYPARVDAAMPASACGDEAGLIARRAGCPVVVDPNRPRAVRHLLETAAVDAVIADDGLQHYALARDAEIAVIDGLRGLGNGFCLPAGPLREPASRLGDCDWIVANGAPTGLGLGESVMTAHATALVNVATGARRAVADFAADAGPLHAVAGIGNPARFQATLAASGIACAVRAFPDHHAFRADDLPPGDGRIVVTEKDAEKIKALDAQTASRCWYLEIDMRFEQSVDERLEQLFGGCGIALGAAREDRPQ